MNLRGASMNDKQQEKPIIKLKEVATDWFAIKATQIKLATAAKYSNILELYLLPRFGDRSVCTITRQEVIAFASDLMSCGGINSNKLSPKTVAGIISVLKNIFDYTSNEKGIEIANIKNISIKQTQRPMRILSMTEQKNLNQYLFCHLNPCNLGILISLYTGLRVGEICALKWADVSMEEHYIYVHQSMQRIQIRENTDKKTKIIIQTPKSDCSIRKIPIPDNLMKLMVLYQKADSAFVLTGSTDRFIEPRNMEYRFKSITSKCKITNVNYHALRHTFATRCVEIGFDAKSLSEILGHASVNITLNRYVHPSMELKQKNMNKLSSILTLS